MTICACVAILCSLTLLKKFMPMKKKINWIRIGLVCVFAGFITVNVQAQQLGNGYAPVVSDLTIPLLSGVYSTNNPTGCYPSYSGASPWSHVLVIRHGTTTNNYQLQIATDFYNDGKVYFRKVCSTDLTSHPNPDWFQFATCGSNTFTGHQRINGSLYANNIYVQQTTWSDDVFSDHFRLMPLNELSAYVFENCHLPDIPTEAEVKEDGVNLADMNALLLRKIEELTLYVIHLQEEVDHLKSSK